MECRRNECYWQNKNEMSQKAKRHTNEVARKYKKEIENCVKNTKAYTGPLDLPSEIPAENYPENIKYSVDQTDSVSAILEKCKGKTAVLNFASYKFPGGKFIEGSTAQEESLCHESFLYNVLKEKESSYYKENWDNLNKALYKDRALYSPNIIFERNGKVANCDVLTCASPNFYVAYNFNSISRARNDEVLRDRIKFILQIAKLEKVDTLILGAFGCGVFGQDPRTVAYLFDKYIKRVFCNTDINIIFAVIPPLLKQTDNLTPFMKRFSKQ